MYSQKPDILSTSPRKGAIQIASMWCMLHFSQCEARKLPNLRTHHTLQISPADISLIRIRFGDESAQQEA